MSKRTVWAVVFSASVLSYAIIAAFAHSLWMLIALIPPLAGAFAAFAYLYNKGLGVPEAENEPRRSNR